MDAGISCRETEKRMLGLGLSIQKVKAIFVSHEHADHINGVPVLAKKYNLPVYITAVTLHQGGLQLNSNQAVPFTASQPVQIGTLSIKAFPKLHDAAEPHSFVVSYKEINIGADITSEYTCNDDRQQEEDSFCNNVEDYRKQHPLFVRLTM